MARQKSSWKEQEEEMGKNFFCSFTANRFAASACEASEVSLFSSLSPQLYSSLPVFILSLPAAGGFPLTWLRSGSMSDCKFNQITRKKSKRQRERGEREKSWVESRWQSFTLNLKVGPVNESKVACNVQASLSPLLFPLLSAASLQMF